MQILHKPIVSDIMIWRLYKLSESHQLISDSKLMLKANFLHFQIQQCFYISKALNVWERPADLASQASHTLTRLHVSALKFEPKYCTNISINTYCQKTLDIFKQEHATVRGVVL